MFIMKKILLPALVSMLAVFPLSGYAAKPISQEFRGGDIQAIFPLKGKPAYMLIGNDFYSSQAPGSAFDWEKTKHFFVREDEHIYFIETTIADEYKGYSYICMTVDKSFINNPPVNLSYAPVSTEIWRLPHDKPKKLDRVLSLSAKKAGANGHEMDNYCVTLFAFKDELYGITLGGDLWKTSNGMKWRQMPSKNLPRIGFTGKVVVTPTNVYASDGKYFMQTKNLKVWNRVKGKFNTDDVAMSESLAVLNDRIYVTTATDDAMNRLWRKKENGKWKQIIAQYEHLWVTNINHQTYLIRETADGQWVIAKSTDGAKFRRVYKSSDQPLEGLTMAGKTIFTMYSKEKGTSYLLRTK